MQPTVFLLPGIMGSNLNVNGKRVWLDYLRLLMGGLGDLSTTAQNVHPADPIDHYYGKLQRFLAASHHVIPFGFDWRLSLQIEARRFDTALASALSEGPVQIVAHSMGGLLARVTFAQNPQRWLQFKASGGRLIFLGTPNGGSYEILRVLTGQSRTMKELALLDIRHNQAELIQIVGQFPGLLEMLPPAHLDPNPHIAICPEGLSIARQTRTLLDQTIFDPAHMIYVAGAAPSTACGMTIDANDANGHVTFQATNHGDGSVDWASGIPTQLEPYYATVPHADLPNHPPDFPAILELLETGATTKYQRTPYLARGGTSQSEQRSELPPDPNPSTPASERTIFNAILGGTAEPEPLQITVAHGNLAFARYPLIVGHHLGDPIAGAEAKLDSILNGALTQRNRLGILPAHIGESEVFAKAIVIGLGRPGDLKQGSLASTFRDGILKYAATTPIWDLRLSSLLIQADLPLESSLRAILQAIHAANEQLLLAGSESRVTAIEFIELWEDRALEAAQCLNLTQIDTRPGGLRRILPHANRSGRWNRLRISSDGASGLRYALVTGRARTEVDLVPADRGLADQFLMEATKSTQADSHLASTLFELLVPNRLKDESLDLDRLVLMVDPESAKYPWELMNGLSVKAGMIRQLETDEFRTAANSCKESTAFVVANPSTTTYPPLAAAATEGLEVADCLSQHHFTVTSQIQTNAMAIVSDLHARCYRILHLAGHGNQDGLIIGDHLLLTPAMIAQMRSVPELVFINCCHSGHMPHHAAANLAIEFIQMGVRAVIAAGWAVDDAAACTFAKAFYDSFLAGGSFGDSVRTARQKTSHSHSNVNTWGAYQCYGDPEYRLVEQEEEDHPLRFLLPSQAVVELENIAKDPQSRDQTKIEQILNSIPTSWACRPDILRAAAHAFSEIGDYDRAYDYYRSYIDQLQALEVNLRVRSAAQRGDKAEIQRCINDIRTNCSKEGRAILASAYKRLALLTGSREPLALMADAYLQAAQFEGPTDYSDLWVNWQLAELILGRNTPPNAEIDQHLVQARLRFARDPNFWNAAAVPDCLMLRALASRESARFPEIKDLYRSAVANYASPKEALTIEEHLAFLRFAIPDFD